MPLPHAKRMTTDECPKKLDASTRTRGGKLERYRRRERRCVLSDAREMVADRIADTMMRRRRG